jgi:hypothetical protein
MDMSQSTQTVVLEIVSFGALAGVSSAQMLDAARDVMAWLHTQPGFLGRKLAQTETGWIDIVTWASLPDAQAAANAFTSNPAAQAFGALIDPATIDMRHANLLQQWS